MSPVTPLFYINKMITQCLEARGRYITHYSPTTFPVKKLDSEKREEKREGEPERLHVVTVVKSYKDDQKIKLGSKLEINK